jgi:uncharacterized membrane protein YqjE
VRLGPRVEFLLFGVILLGLGTLGLAAILAALVAAAIKHEWQTVASIAEGAAFVALIPLVGVLWLRQKRSDRRNRS